MNFNFVLLHLPPSEMFIQSPCFSILISLNAHFLRSSHDRQRENGYPHFTGGELRQENPVIKMSSLERQSPKSYWLSCASWISVVEIK